MEKAGVKLAQGRSVRIAKILAGYLEEFREDMQRRNSGSRSGFDQAVGNAVSFSNVPPHSLPGDSAPHIPLHRLNRIQRQEQDVLREA